MQIDIYSMLEGFGYPRDRVDQIVARRRAAVAAGEVQALPSVGTWVTRDDLIFSGRSTSDPSRGIRPQSVARPKIAVRDCKQCDGTGSIFVREGIYHVAADCVCMLAVRACENYNRMQLPHGYFDATLESTNWHHESAAAIRPEMVRLMTDWRPAMTGYIASGRNGTGKSRSAAIVCAALALRGPTDYGDRDKHDVGRRLISVRHAEWRTLCRKIRDGFSKGIGEEVHLAPLINCDVLWLDELGAGQRTDWSDALVESLVSERAESRRTTIFTTNLPADRSVAPKGFKGDTLRSVLGDRAMSRLVEHGIYVEMNGPDYRRPGERRKLGVGV